MADPVWRKSSFSDNGKRLEIARLDDTVLIRNSNDHDRVVLAMQPAALATFVVACAAGCHDNAI